MPLAWGFPVPRSRLVVRHGRDGTAGIAHGGRVTHTDGMGDETERDEVSDAGQAARRAAAKLPESPWWQRLMGVGLVVALEVPLILVLASANDLSTTHAILTVLVISGGTTLASGAAFLLRREEERADRMARAAAVQERAEGAL